MLIGNFMTSLFNVAKYGFFSIFLYIDSVVYKIVSMLFSVFFSLAELQLLKDDAYQAISSRIYLLVGIVALFSITISLLKALVNPDNLGKGTISSFKNLIVSMLLVILMPTIFKYAFSFQAAIINDGVINNLFNFSITTGENEMVNECNNPKDVSVNTADNETLNSEINMTVDECQANYITMTVLQAFFSPSNDNVTNNYGTTWKDARRYIWYTGDFDYIATFAEQVNKGDSNSYITYYIIITTIAGFFLGYVVLSFCLDLGIRAFKLAFYELIAPLPILMKIVPGQEGKFDKWRKEVVSTFLEVFVRLIIISFIIFMCGNLFDLIKNLSWGETGAGLLAKAILALGLFAFAKQAPKLLKDALGLEGSGVKFGIKGKLTDVPVAGKAFAAGYGVANKAKGAATGALGAGYSSMVNGGSFGAGARFGAASGWKSGGQQFGKMRQETYKQMGYKGKAGWIGGQSKMDKLIDDNRNKFSDNFKDNVLRKWVQDFENNPNGIWQKAYSEKKTELTNQYRNTLNQAKGQYEQLINSMNSEVAKANKEYDDAIAGFKINNPGYTETSLNQKMQDYSEKRNENINTIKEKYQDQIKDAEYSIKSSESLLSGGTAIRVNERGFQEKFSIDSDSRDYAIGVAGDKDPTYKNRKKVDEKRLKEKDVEKYTNSLEGQQAIAVQQQALKNLQTPDAPAGPGKPGMENKNKKE